MNLLDNNVLRFLARLKFPKTVSSTKHFEYSDELTNEEAFFFAENGYLVKTNAVPQSFIEQSIDYGWSFFPPHFARTRPESWIFPIQEKFCGTIIDNQGKISFPVKYEPWMKDIFSKNSCIQSTVAGLMGAERLPTLPVINGIYFTFPVSINKLTTPYIHTDTGPDIVRFIVYLSDVEPGGGGFHVWPGSHLVLRHLYPREAGSAPDMSKYWTRLYNCAFQTPAVEIAAPAGTAIFWHHRLAHAAGINRSKDVRQVFIAGYPSLDINYRETLEVPDDPWEHWVISPSQVKNQRG